MNARKLKRSLLAAIFVGMFLLLGGGVAAACPNCKEGLVHSNYARAYGWSIVFMMFMPFLILGSLVAYMYYEVRRARARQQSVAAGRASAGEKVGRKLSQRQLVEL